MSVWTAELVNTLLQAQLPKNWFANGISIDTRTLKPSDIYVALKGMKQDGHDYVAQAYAAGASAALVDHVMPGLDGFPQIVVGDVLEGLRVLARAARARTSAKIAGITGSVGKTSTKEALNFILSDQALTYATPRSFNNHWGVPLAVALLPENAVYGILEMGMNNPGEISGHTQLVKPHVAYITNIESMHIGKMGSQKAIALAKAEIFEGLQPGGIAIINMNSHEPHILESAAQGFEIWRIGADIRLLACEEFNDHQMIQADIHGQIISYRLNLVGKHWATNSLGILAVAKALGANTAKAAEKLGEFSAVAGRGQQHQIHLADGGPLIIIDESYNAGPVSMKAAFEVLHKTSLQGKCRRIAVLGDMLELGPTEKEDHQNLKNDIIKNHIDLVFTSGERMAELAKVLPPELRGSHRDDPKILAADICAQAQPGDIYMVKGSRGGYQAQGRMHSVVEALLKLDQKGR